jgi:flavin-dependent dehydrogenase
LDPILLETAVAGGAEVRDATAVLDVLRDGDRVSGVRARKNGSSYEIRASWIIGADGRNSTIAKRVGAEQYHSGQAARGGYWAYFPVTPAFEKLPFQTYIEITGASARFAFRTDADLVIAGAFDLPSIAKTWTRDPACPVIASLAGSNVTRLLVEGNAPVTRFLGLLHGEWYFRPATGPGWALVGDAGLHKDPTPGYGITDAFRDAKSLAKALLDGREAALDVYWRRRDVESIPFFENALAMGSLDYDNPLNELILTRASESPAIIDRLRKTLERTLSPFDAIPPWRVLAWVGGALLRGRTEIWPHFVTAGKRGQRIAKELAYRKGLLEQAEAKLARRG